jgi:hypothetical protein
MKSVYFILASLSFVILSCKKETAKHVSGNPESSCVCLKENIGVELANHVSCYGFLIMTTYTDQTRNTPFSHVATTAFFSGVAAVQESGNSIVTVDSVYLNQQSLKSIKDANGAHMYYQSDYGSWPSQQEWSIFGANGIPTFTVNADVKNPVADFSLVPDSISKSHVKSFKINGVANITGGTALIFSSENSGGNVSVILREGSNEICFPVEQLKQVSTGKATVLIILENTMTKVFGNKNFAFSKRLQYEKTITLNP